MVMALVRNCRSLHGNAQRLGGVMDHKLSKQEVADLCKKDYIVIEAPGQGALVERVNQMRAFGFEPVGEITKMHTESKPRLWQAMQRLRETN